MANNSLTNCPHCSKPIVLKVVPLSKLATFENVANSPFPDEPPTQQIIEQKSFWATDAANYGLSALFAGGVMIAFSWWYSLDAGVIIAGTMLVVGVGLHILKIWLHRPPQLPPPPTPNTIKIEQQSNDKQHWLLAELDFIYHPEKFYRAMSEVDRRGKWTRKITTGSGLSQGQHAKLQDKFVEMGYLMPLGNNCNGFIISGAGRRAIKQIALFGQSQK